MNKVILMGNLVRDVELRKTPSGKTVGSFSIATNKRFTRNGQVENEATFHNLVVWEKRAEVIAQYFYKGDKILIEGEIVNRSWEKDGVKHYATDILVSNFFFVGGGKEGTTQNNNQAPKTTTKQAVQNDPNMDLENWPDEEPQDEEIRVENIPF